MKLLLELALAHNVAAAQWRISWAAQAGEINYRVCRVVGASLFIRQKTNP